MFAPTRQWLSLYVASVRTVMRELQCTPNSCIEAACIGAGVARAFGYLAEPVPVRAAVLSADQATALVLPGPPGTKPRGLGGFDGHVVLFVAGGFLVDLTAEQFHMPRRGLHVPGPIVLPGLAREVLTGGVEVDLETGTTVRYVEMVDNVAWRATPAWRESSEFAIRAAVQRIREGRAARRLQLV